MDSPLTSKKTLDVAREKFILIHQQTFGHSSQTDPVELVNFRVDGFAKTPKPKVLQIAQGGRDAGEARSGSRKVFFKSANDVIECRTYDRSLLKSGNILEGPAIIDQADTTVVVPPGYTCRVDTYGNLWIAKK